MRTVFKYRLTVDDAVTIKMPKFAKILSVGVQQESVFLWALVDTDKLEENRHFRIAGTGHPIEEAHLTFLGTVFLMRGQLVFHIFEIE